MRIVRQTAVLISGCALWVTLGCAPRSGSEAKVETQEPPFNVVLVVMDTTRADHIGCYGYPRSTTPNVDAFARHATRYANARSVAPWTLPSHSSMFTGLPPHEHGAHTFDVEERENNVSPLAEDVPVITEVFRELGYETAAFVANNVYLTPRWGLSRGFDTYVVKHSYAKEHNRKVFRWLDERGGEPFFLFVNYMDAHRPYNIEPVPGLLPNPPDRNVYLIDDLKRRVMGTDEPVPQGLRRKVIDQYDTGIANMDEGIGELLVELDRRGLRDRTVIVITSDHGEYFGEHRLVEHNLDVYEGGVRTPLVIGTPGREPSVNEAHVTSEDLPFLLADHMPSKRVREAMLRFAAGPGSHPVLVENYYSRLWDVFSEEWGHRFQRVRRGVYEWPYKLIHSSDGNHELYDLARDPAEENDVYDEHPELAARLLAKVEAEVQEVRAPSDTSALTDLEIQQMRALGYME